jgi:HSP20 family molecular chaperone IbpA
MRLPVDADLESVTAKLSEGILSVNMKKLEGKTPKKIDIQVD